MSKEIKLREFTSDEIRLAIRRSHFKTVTALAEHIDIRRDTLSKVISGTFSLLSADKLDKIYVAILPELLIEKGLRSDG